MSNNLLLQSVGTGTTSGSSTQTLEQFSGSDCSGSDGDANRVLTTSGVSGASGEVMVVMDGQLLRKTDKYTVSGDDITFLVKVFDSSGIDIFYVTGSITQTLEQFSGSDCSGSDGDANRVLTTSGVSGASGEIIIGVDGQIIRKTDKFTVSGDDVTFLIKIFDSSKIDIFYIT